MNNSNGAALLARIRAGMLVTVRDDSGQQATGRAYLHNGETLQIALPAGHFIRPTESNIVRVSP